MVGLDPASMSRIVHGLWCKDEVKVAIAGALGRSVADLWPSHGEASDQQNADLNSDHLGRAA